MSETSNEKRRAKLRELRQKRGTRTTPPAQDGAEEAGAGGGRAILRRLAQRRADGSAGGLLGGNRLGGDEGNGAEGGGQDRPLLRKLLAQRRRGKNEDGGGGGLGRLRERFGNGGDPEKLRARIEERIEKLRGLIHDLDERKTAPTAAEAENSEEPKAVKKV